MDIGKGLMTTPILTLVIYCYLHPPSATAHVRHTCTHTQNQREEICESELGAGGRIRSRVGRVVMYLAHYLQDQTHFPSLLLYLTSQSW